MNRNLDQEVGRKVGRKSGRKIVATLLVAAFSLSLTTACIGRMAVSSNVREFNLNVAENRWARAGVFVLLYVIPVYPIAGAIDLLIVNSIEFHTGTNPVNGEKRLAQAGETRRAVAPDGTVSVSTLREDGSIDFEITDPSGETHFVNLERRGDQVVASDRDGQELASAGPEGRLTSLR